MRLNVPLNVQNITAQDFSIALMVVAISVFVPLLLVWGFIYLVIFLVRWINRPPEAAKSRPQTTVTPAPRARHRVWKKVGLSARALRSRGARWGRVLRMDEVRDGGRAHQDLQGMGRLAPRRQPT